MAEETYPRFGLTPVEFVETDTAKIKDAIISGYEEASGRTLADGDPVRLFLLSIAAIIIQQRECINTAAQQNLLSYAQGEYLDSLGLIVACERLGGSRASALFRITLAQALGNDYSIPAGFKITNGEVTFATDEESIIPAGDTYCDVLAYCTDVGVVGNGFKAGQINKMVTPLTFLAKAENIEETLGGKNATEDDVSYANRIRTAINTFSVAGPKKAYEYHAKSANSNILNINVCSPSAGMVEVYILMNDGQLPDKAICNSVKAYLSSDDIRPLTDYVTVSAPVPKDYAINIDYTIDDGDIRMQDAIKTAIMKATENYRLWQQSKISRDISPEQLISAVIGAGATHIDFKTLSPRDCVTLNDNEVAQCSAITINGENVYVAPYMPMIESCADASLGEYDKLTSGEDGYVGVGVLGGKNLNFDENAEDEGVFIEVIGVTDEEKCEVINAKDGTIVFNFNGENVAGEPFKIIFRTRGGIATRETLLEATRQGVFVAAESEGE